MFLIRVITLQDAGTRVGLKDAIGLDYYVRFIDDNDLRSATSQNIVVLGLWGYYQRPLVSLYLVK